MRPSTLPLLLLALALSGGCKAVNSYVEGMYSRSKVASDLISVRQETRSELRKQEQEALTAAADQQKQIAQSEAQRRRLEQEICRANQEALSRRLQAQIQDSVDSKLSFNVNQGLEVGELEVDLEALKKLIAEREKEPQRRPREPLRKKPCKSCSERTCGCSHGLLRKFCHACRKRSCGCPAEKDCGGPEALTRMEQEPLRRPLRPAEIPLKLPVRLTFGMQNPQVTDTSIRREPLLGPPREPLRRDCVDGDRNRYCPTGKCPNGRCPNGVCPHQEMLPPPRPLPEGS